MIPEPCSEEGQDFQDVQDVQDWLTKCFQYSWLLTASCAPSFDSAGLEEITQVLHPVSKHQQTHVLHLGRAVLLH